MHYFLSDFQILQTQVLGLNSVYSGGKLNIFCALRTCKARIFCYTMSDLSIVFTCACEQRHVLCLSEQYCRRQLFCICARLSLGTKGAEETREEGFSCCSCNNNVTLFWAIAPAKGNRIRLSVATNIHFYQRMMKYLLWLEMYFFFTFCLICKSGLVKLIFIP